MREADEIQASQETSNALNNFSAHVLPIGALQPMHYKTLIPLMHRPLSLTLQISLRRLSYKFCRLRLLLLRFSSGAASLILVNLLSSSLMAASLCDAAVDKAWRRRSLRDRARRLRPAGFLRFLGARRAPRPAIVEIVDRFVRIDGISNPAAVWLSCLLCLAGSGLGLGARARAPNRPALRAPLYSYTI